MTKILEPQVSEKISALQELRNYILNFPEELQRKTLEAYQRNNWFTIENQETMLRSIANYFLEEKKSEHWLENYELKNSSSKKIGIIMAGNIPLVGFHDLLCVWLTGNIAHVKLSSKDEVLLPFLISEFEKLAPSFIGKTVFAERLNNIDAIIATGSNNSTRYFEYYFGKMPHLFRSNRSSVAVFTGEETSDEIFELGKDIFRYFGLGCRNVSKIFLPENFSPEKILEGLSSYSEIIHHNKYKSNYDYNRTLLLMNNTPHLANEFLMLVEKEHIVSPVATVHYEFYKTEKELEEKISSSRNQIQCIVGKNFIPFGKSQEPELNEYADDVDTMKFLVSV